MRDRLVQTRAVRFLGIAVAVTLTPVLGARPCVVVEEGVPGTPVLGGSSVRVAFVVQAAVGRVRGDRERAGAVHLARVAGSESARIGAEEGVALETGGVEVLVCRTLHGVAGR